MNLEDIAQKAGVSKSTVSRVVNNEEYVSESTREKVMAVIEAEGYRPHPAARSLVTRRTHTIGVIMDNGIDSLFDPSLYLPSILKGISQATTERDYSVMLSLSLEQESDERFAQRITRSRLMDGFIIISPTLNSSVVPSIIQARVPFVTTDRIDYPGYSASYATVENIESSRNAVHHMIRLGRRKIVCLAGSETIVDSHDRMKGYHQALAEAGIPRDKKRELMVEFETDDAYNAITKLLEDGIEFDGIFAGGANISIGALHAVLNHGLQIPEDVALVGFDDLIDPAAIPIPLTSIRQPTEEKGKRCANLLIDMLEGITLTPRQEYLIPELIIRETCGGLKNEQTAT